MKKDKTTLILFSLLAVLAFAPMVQEHLHFPHVRPLAGVMPETKPPKRTLANYRNGKYQRATEQYLKYHFGFRPNVIRLYNQYLWDCYKKTHNKTNLRFGKEGWLYEPWFVEDYYHGGTYSQKMDSLKLAEKFDQEAFRLLQLQNILETYGTTLVVCQAPGKDLIYPEFLPDDTVTTRPKQLSARDAYEERFNQLGINHINLEQLFLQMKDTASFLLFPQKGTHWSNIAAIYAADSIFHYIEAKKGISMNQLEIGAPTIGPYRKPDYDLEELLNLCRPLKRLPQHYVDVKVRQVPGAVKPKMIVVGDSYYWNICAQISIKSMFANYPYWYYNNTIHFDSLHHNTSEVNLAHELLDADVVLLMYCSTQLYKMSNGFSQKALLALCYDEEDITQAEEACIRNIRNNPKWLEGIQQRAETFHLSMEEVIIAEAKNLIQQKPQLFLNGLQDSIPTQRSAKVTEYLQLKTNTDGIQ
ncbi:MAG: hypothetical protein K5920_00200 [Bacteroidales bacterium]|nr:hypothetical protein [Bacteroidales bacterium]